MAIHGVDTKCYILALFVRDDGERFLLGSGHYEFKDTQMHFAANAIQNDIVEVQGNDGFLLAGQVRRPGTQSFDGYVGDGTMSKEDTESYRRQFFSFFRKNFFYKVIYVFSDGTAIQRKRGFLVDDPTVQELYQIYPEYHVALNFEDVNYYSYSEDDEGHEQYAKEATIDLSSMRATGGLEWDNLGVIWEATQWGGEQNIKGTELTIQNDLGLSVPIDDEKMEGDTFQQTYSGTNLYNYTDLSASIGSGITTDSDGWITCTIDNSAGTSTRYSNYYTNPLALTPSTNYALVLEIRSVSGTGAFSGGGGGTATQVNTFSVDFSDMTSGQTIIVPITSKSDVTGANGLRSYFRFNAGQSGSVTLRISVLADTSVTPQTFVYQPYTGGIPAPNPDYPQTVQTVADEQTVALDDGNGTTLSYTIDLGSIELCKIGDYQDYIYKSGNDWYVHKEIDSVTISCNITAIIDNTGSSSASGQSYAGAFMVQKSNWDAAGGNYDGTIANAIVSYNIGQYKQQNINANAASNTMDDGTFCQRTGTNDRIYFRLSRYKGKTGNEMKALLLSNGGGSNFYYYLSAPTDTKITDTSLISQLNALGAMRLFIGGNNLTVQATGTNLPGPISFKYYTSVNMTGAEWEEGGSGGATVVEVDSITNIYPIWKVTGPAVNPALSVITTNTTIQYSGTITGTQTLEVDMFNKTAKLNGASVIGNISGDWVNFSPGTNRVLYTADNTDALPSTIEWQEVVG